MNLLKDLTLEEVSFVSIGANPYAKVALQESEVSRMIENNIEKGNDIETGITGGDNKGPDPVTKTGTKKTAEETAVLKNEIEKLRKAAEELEILKSENTKMKLEILEKERAELIEKSSQKCVSVKKIYKSVNENLFSSVCTILLKSDQTVFNDFIQAASTVSKALDSTFGYTCNIQKPYENSLSDNIEKTNLTEALEKAEILAKKFEKTIGL